MIIDIKQQKKLRNIQYILITELPQNVFKNIPRLKISKRVYGESKRSLRLYLTELKLKKKNDHSYAPNWIINPTRKFL